MKVSLRSQFNILIIPLVGVLVALLVAVLAPFQAAREDVRHIERELAYRLEVQGFADSFADVTREYADFVVSGERADFEEAAGAIVASRRSLAAWGKLAAEDGGSEREIVRQISADHARVVELGAELVRLRNDARELEAGSVLTEQLIPMMRTMLRKVDQSLLQHDQAISHHTAKIAGGIGYSTILELGGMHERVQDLDSHVGEVLDSIIYKRAIDKEVQGYRQALLSAGAPSSNLTEDHQSVNEAFAIWRVAVKRAGDHLVLSSPIHELRLVDGVQLKYLALHRIGEEIAQLPARSRGQLQVLLLKAQSESDGIATVMQKYTAGESRIAAESLELLRLEALRAYRVLIAVASIVILIGLGVPWFLSRVMIEPIQELQQGALRISNGDLETRIRISSTNELGSLAAAFNDMAGELKISRSEDLKKSEERFQLAARSTRDMIWDWDIRADKIWHSEEFRKIFGVDDQGLPLNHSLALLHPDDRQRIESGLRGVISGPGQFWSDEYRFLRLDGTIAQMSDRGYIVRDEAGLAIRMIGAVTDITLRKAAEQAMATLHRQKELILNSVGEGIVGLDGGGYITSVNPAAARMLACDGEDLLGTAIRQVARCADLESIVDGWQDSPIHRTLLEGTLESSDRELFWRKDGSSFPADYVSNPMVDDGGNVVGAVVTFRDITERYEVDRLKSQFVSTVSHELRTPLTSIRGALGLLTGGLLGNVSARGQRMLEIAVSNTDRLVRLINDILDVERIESGKMEMARDVINAHDLMMRAAEGIQSMADSAAVRLRIEPTTASLIGDADRVIQTLTNLLGNAIKFSPRDTMVTLSASCAGGDCTFRVADQGRGVPKGKLEMIFERFQQMDASDSRDKGGSGLGLAICRSIVNAHGGRIWAEGNHPSGTVFQFTIPSAIAPVARGVGSEPRTLLVCQEKDSAIPRIVEMLEGHGFHVLCCPETEVAARVVDIQPDAIILDLASSGGHGWQVVEALKSEPDTRDVPIVVATMQSPESWENYATVVASWVRRPFGSEDLLDAVVEACSGPSILLVEDDADLAGVMTAVLHTHGVRTFHAASGQEAVDLCRQHEPSLIVLDLGLPDMDGFAVVKLLRESATLRRVPLLVYSGLDVGRADQKRLELGPTEFLTKGRAGLKEFEASVVRLLDTITMKDQEVSHAA